MAVTGNATKTRLDFAEAVKEAMNPPEAVTKKEPVKREKKEREEEKRGAEVKKPTAPAKEKKEKKPDIFSGFKPKQTGVQKSVYMDRDIAEYIEKKDTETKLGFSVITNILLRRVIEETEEN